MQSEREHTLLALKLGREHANTMDTWVWWSERYNRNVGTVYWFASKGWAATGHQGPYYDIVRALRKHVEDGDLTQWHQHRQGIRLQGRSRREMVELFDKAIAALEQEGISE